MTYTAEERAREAKVAADAVVTPSFAPESYSAAERLFTEASAALQKESFAEAHASQHRRVPNSCTRLAATGVLRALAERTLPAHQ